MIRSAMAGLTAAALLATAGVAGAANGKQRVIVERLVDEFSLVVVDCSELGPYSFSIHIEGTLRVSITDVVGKDGSLLQTVFHFGLDETDTNTVSGKSLRLHGAAHEVWDYASNTRTLSGSVFIGTERGRGTYVQDTGRITMTLDTRVAQFVAGPHEAFFAGGIDPVMCNVLAES
jgi:hypothetical protein